MSGRIMNFTNTEEKIRAFFRGKKTGLSLVLIGAFEAVNLYVMRLFILRRFPDGARAFLAVLNSPKVKYNTEFYDRMLHVVYVAASFFVGGILVFLFIKTVCRLAVLLRLIDREWLGGLVPAAYALLFGVGWGITGTTAWLCPFVAYAGGLLFFLLSGVGSFKKTPE